MHGEVCMFWVTLKDKKGTCRLENICKVKDIYCKQKQMGLAQCMAPVGIAGRWLRLKRTFWLITSALLAFQMQRREPGLHLYDSPEWRYSPLHLHPFITGKQYTYINAFHLRYLFIYERRSYTGFCFTFCCVSLTI